MNIAAIIQRGLLILCASLMASCIDVREEYWLHEDGGAEAEFTYHLPATGMVSSSRINRTRATIERILSAEERIDSHEVNVSEADGRYRIRIRIKIDDVMAWKNLKSAISEQKELPEAVRYMVGEFETGMASLTTVSVSRRISLGKALPALKWLPASQMDGHKIVHVIHLPEPVVSSNADDSWDGGRSLSWETPLAIAIREPVITRMEVRLPIPWKWLAGGTLILGGAAILLIRLLRRVKSRRA